MAFHGWMLCVLVEFKLFQDLLCCLSAPAHELCSLIGASDILSVTWYWLTVDLGDPVMWFQILGNTFGFNDQYRSSFIFRCAWYLAECLKAFSSGKNFINTSSGYVI